MEPKKTNIIIILLCTIILLLCVVLGIVLLNNKKDNKQPEQINNIKTPEPTTDEIFTSILGEWGKCKGEYNCQGLIIDKTDKGFTYREYQMWSEGEPAGDITKVEKKDDNIYEIVVHRDAYDYVEVSGPETTNTYTINISELSNNKLIVGNEVYQKIIGDREEFFKSIMK